MALLTSALLVLASTSADPITDAKVVGASLFKNGYAVVLREATIPASGRLLLRQPQNVALGTFWVSAPKDVTLKEIVATTVSDETSRDIGTIDEIIQANKGRNVTLLMNGNSTGASRMVGTILSAEGQIIVFKSQEGVVTFPKGFVAAVMSTDGGLEWKAKQTSSQQAVRMSGTPGGKVYYTVLQRGLTWTPAYQVDISDPKELTLTAKATILDDLEDINGLELRLVTGFPNIPFINLPDPFSAAVVAEQYLNGMLNRGSRDQFANNMPMGGGGFGGQMAYRAAEASIAPMPLSDLEGFSAEDLFFYRQDKVTLKKGDRGYYVLMQAKSDYEHIYTLDVPQMPMDTTPGRNLPPLETWHELKFKNTSKQPLTTGTILTEKNGELLGQDMLTYTPVGAEQFVKITKALDISADQMEEETGRVRGEIKDRFGNPVWDLVTIHGKIVVTSRKKDVVKMMIAKDLVGEATEADHTGKITKFVRRLSDVNTPSKVTWETDIKGGDKLELNYTYKLYQPSR
ncbi:MAG: hypothetical protein JSS65_06805 [Armatimonadetes bacterium]|nr:hypothetical protein [Armatimonadota bacterium]